MGFVERNEDGKSRPNFPFFLVFFYGTVNDGKWMYVSSHLVFRWGKEEVSVLRKPPPSGVS